MKKKVYYGDGVTFYDPAQAYEGLTMIQGWFAEGPQLRLIDMEGNIVHRWIIDFFKIWPDSKHIIPEKNIPKGSFDYHTKGMAVLQDGSIVANISNIGTVKLDKCGKVLWTLNRMTHHSITPTDEGGFWIPANRNIREISDDLIFNGSREDLEHTEGRYENIILLVDANGQIQKEFSVLRALYEGAFERQLYDTLIIRNDDPTHVNDIEIVNSVLAHKIEGVNEGDLLVSIKLMHMLAIFDRETGRIKWHHTGPWIRQHDPDITPEGNIVVFNNAKKELSFNRPPGSSLIELDPATGETRTIYPFSDENAFWTKLMGTHQLLPNGNRLINVSQAGRLFEINKQNDLVWEYIKPYDYKYAALFEDAKRYETDYFTVDDWSCE